MSRALIIFFLVAAVSARAQQTLPRVGETVEVAIVNVDVVVTDRQGNRVRGLRTEDFELRENGTVQPISNFAEYAGRAEQGTVSVEVPAPAPGAAAAPQPAPRERRTLLIFFESMQLPGKAADEFANALKEAVHRLIGPGDAVSLVIWSQSRTDHVAFTNNVAAIDAAIGRIAEDAKGARPDLIAQQRQETAARRLLDRMSREAGLGSEAATDPLGDVQLPMLTAYTEMVARVNAINSAISSMAGIEGRKILLLATRRLGEVAGAEFAYEVGVEQMTPYLKSRFGTERMMKSIVDNANASGVTIYPVNPPGLGKDTGDTEYYAIDDELSLVSGRGAIMHRNLINETVSLEKIAKQTGGLMAIGPKAVIDLLPRIVSDATDYYSLAYRVTTTGRDHSRDIVVKTRNPEYTVRARSQFVEKSDESRMRERLRSTLVSANQPDASIAIRAAARPRERGRSRTKQQVRVRIPIGALTLMPQGNGKYAGRFSVYVGAAADLDEVSDVTQKTQSFEIEEAKLAQARTGHFTYDLDVEVSNTSRYLAVGVFDEIGKSFGLARVELVPKQ